MYGRLSIKQRRLRSGDDARAKHVRSVAAPASVVRQQRLNLRLLGRVVMGVGAPRGDLLCQRLRVIAMEAVRGHRGGVHQPRSAGRDRRLEHIARAEQVHLAALARAAHDHERQVHDHVGATHERRYRVAVEHIPALVGDLLPAPGVRVKRPARHAED